jgi:hypothetical protein
VNLPQTQGENTMAENLLKITAENQSIPTTHEDPDAAMPTVPNAEGTTDMVEPTFNPVEWVTTREAAELSGYTKENIIKAKQRGLLEAVKRGNMLFFRSRDIVEYAKRMREKGTSKYTPKKFRII